MAVEQGGPERIQKVLAARGVASRRAIEELIVAGRVLVNGQPAVLGQRVWGTERIVVGGRPVARARQDATSLRVLAYHKPIGEMVTRRDPEGRATVFEKLPPLRGARWIPVGRLDVNTSGLLLLTNSGDLAAKLMHPSTGIERRYAVRVIGQLSNDSLARLRQGVQLDDGLARFSQIESTRSGEGANRWYAVSLQEGRNREVRRLFGAVGATVSRLIRTGYGPIDLPRDLPRGRWQLLPDNACLSLVKACEQA